MEPIVVIVIAVAALGIGLLVGYTGGQKGL